MQILKDCASSERNIDWKVMFFESSFLSILNLIDKLIYQIVINRKLNSNWFDSFRKILFIQIL